ncbi:unnamed protein product [Musa acuminata var. zebrina]
MVAERVVTVEYLEPTMSRELLGKFPDNSAFDFDYSQSGIWSPLLPRGIDDARKKLLAGSPVTLRRVKAKLTYKKRKKKRPSAIRKSLDFSPVPSPKLVMLHPCSTQSWPAAKRFKVHARSPLQMMLPTL